MVARSARLCSDLLLLLQRLAERETEALKRRAARDNPRCWRDAGRDREVLRGGREHDLSTPLME